MTGEDTRGHSTPQYTTAHHTLVSIIDAVRDILSRRCTVRRVPHSDCDALTIAVREGLLTEAAAELVPLRRRQRQNGGRRQADDELFVSDEVLGRDAVELRRDLVVGRLQKGALPELASLCAHGERNVSKV
jgi:hypothetical protein